MVRRNFIFLNLKPFYNCEFHISCTVAAVRFGAELRNSWHARRLHAKTLANLLFNSQTLATSAIFLRILWLLHRLLSITSSGHATFDLKLQQSINITVRSTLALSARYF